MNLFYLIYFYVFNVGVEDVKTQSMVPYASSSSRNINIHPSRTTTTIYDEGLKFGYRNLLSSPSQIHPIKNFVQGIQILFLI